MLSPRLGHLVVLWFLYLGRLFGTREQFMIFMFLQCLLLGNILLYAIALMYSQWSNCKTLHMEDYDNLRLIVATF